MPTPQPIYTADNCQVAYQLNWGLTTNWRQPPGTDQWLDELTSATEQDHVRILKHRFANPTTSQFLISTQPQIVPTLIPARIKGRLQHLIRERFPKAFQRNYLLRSIGSTRGDKLDAYLASQPERHRMADPRVQTRLQRYQIHNPQVDLSAARFSEHAKYWYNLHVVFVNEDRLMEVRDEVLSSLREMVLKASTMKRHLLSRAAILPDHVHLTLGCSLGESPLEVGLSYMNNLAWACGMKRVFQRSLFLGTFGEYDLGAIR